MDPQQPVRDDTAEAEGRRWAADGENDDVEGHGRRVAMDAGDDTDDVQGHLSGALGSKQKEDREYR